MAEILIGLPSAQTAQRAAVVRQVASVLQVHLHLPENACGVRFVTTPTPIVQVSVFPAGSGRTRRGAEQEMQRALASLLHTDAQQITVQIVAPPQENTVWRRT